MCNVITHLNAVVKLFLNFMKKNQAEMIFFQAHSLFINEIRSEIHTICLREFGNDWQQNYSATFRHERLIETWNRNIRDGIRPEDLIECSNLEMFSDVYKKSQFFMRKFGRNNFRIPTYFTDIAKARNMVSHNATYDSDIADLAYLSMIVISRKLKKENLENKIRALKDGSNIEEKINAKPKFRDKSNRHSNADRLFSNAEIQIKITTRAQTLSEDELNRLCDKDYSRDTFNNTYPIFVKVPQNSSREERQSAIKDHNNNNRWTVKYEFIRNNYSYFITTQWYPRNDEYVKDWLQRKNT